MTLSKYERIGVVILLLLNLILVGAVINLGAFASKGPRYTADDGARERQERITTDLALAARIDHLHSLFVELESGQVQVTQP
jgi:hypothetical protein